jgi:agmatine deiminase
MTALRMPAEWEPHERVWLAWPHLRSDWPGKFAPIPFVFAEIIRGITRNGRAGLVVRDAAMQQAASEILTLSQIDLSRIDFLHHPTNRGWLRDCGAIFVHGKNKKLTALDFRFNGWAKYANHKKDDALAAEIAQYTGDESVAPAHSIELSRRERRVVLEGGAIEVDGLGTLITTEECLLSDIQCRNPGFTRADYEAVFAQYLDITHTIWLGNGIEGDDTHGHIDDLTRFVAPGRVVTVIEPNKKRYNYAPLRDNLKRLKKAQDARGKGLDIIELPMPEPVVFDNQILPASYANFLITNGVVLVPVFNDPADRLALSLLAEAMPRHDILPIYARDLVLGLGTIHCLTQQQPA